MTAVIVLLSLGACTSAADDVVAEPSAFTAALLARRLENDSMPDGATEFTVEQAACIDELASGLGQADLEESAYADLSRETQEAIAEINDECLDGGSIRALVRAEFVSEGFEWLKADCVKDQLMRVVTRDGWAEVFLDRDEDGAHFVNAAFELCELEPTAVPLIDGKPIGG